MLVTVRRNTKDMSQFEQAHGGADDGLEHRQHVVGDWLMTRRMSALAVWRASASSVSLNRRTFSVAITAWPAKVCSRSTSLAAKRPTCARVTVIAPTMRRSRHIGTLRMLR